jgi:hypothetical protein
MGASLVKYKGSSRQSFREVSETIPGLKSQVKRGVGDPERVVPGSLLANVNSQEEKSTDEGGPVRRSWPELVALRAILLNALFKQANAQTLTAEEMQRLIDRAD